MQLNRAELANSFNVSLNTISSWTRRGCPMASPGGRGVSSAFIWREVEHWAREFKAWRHVEPSEAIAAAYQRAKDIVKLRNQRKQRKPHA